MDFAYYGVKNGRAIPVVGLCGYQRIDESRWGFKAIVWYNGYLGKDVEQEFELTPLTRALRNTILYTTFGLKRIEDKL
jgi:hypothetical protein